MCSKRTFAQSTSFPYNSFRSGRSFSCLASLATRTYKRARSFPTRSFHYLFLSGRSSVGRARGSGPRGRRFESFRSDQFIITRGPRPRGRRSLVLSLRPFKKKTLAQGESLGINSCRSRRFHLFTQTFKCGMRFDKPSFS